MGKNFTVFIIFIFLTLFFTYPIIFNLSSAIYGPLKGTDVEGSLHGFWWVKYAHQNNLKVDYVTVLNYPFGIDYSKFPTQGVWVYITRIITLLKDDIFSYNFTTLISFILSGIFAYYLVWYLTKSRLAGLFSGIVFAFCPYHFNKAFEHPGLVHIQWLALYLWMLLKLFKFRNFAYLLLSSIAFWLIISFDYYCGYFMTLVTIGILFFIFIYNWKNKFKSFSLFKMDFHYLGLIILMVFIAFLLCLPSLFSILKSVFFTAKVGLEKDLYVRPFNNLFSQSARPFSYLLPAKENPILGRIMQSFQGSIFYGRNSIEHTLYLGWVPLFLSLIAFKGWKRNRIKIANYRLPITDYQRENDFYIGLFIFIAIFSFIFSMPPYFNLGLFKLYMPSFFMYKILPMFRAYARFGVIVMLAVSVLAGFGLKFILDRQKTKFRRYLVTAIFISFVLFEFNNIPPFHVTDISQSPEVYKWLAEQPGDFVIIEYPMSSYLAHQDYLFNQRYHAKKMVNGALPGTGGFKLKKKIMKITSPQTAGILKYIGVKYAILHLDRYRRGEDRQAVDVIGQVPDLRNSHDFQLIKAFKDVEVYKIQAEPIEIDLNKYK